MILKCSLAELFGCAEIAQQHVGCSQRQARIPSFSGRGSDSVLSIELPASLRRRFCLFQCAQTAVIVPQVTKHPSQENFRLWVAVIQYLEGFFESVDTFAQTPLDCIKHEKGMLRLFDNVDPGMLNRPRPGGTNIIDLRLDL